MKRLLSRNPSLWMLAPFLVGAVGLFIVPAFLTFALAFYEYDAISPPVYVGDANFKEVFADPLFTIAVKNSLYFIALAIPLRVIGALVLALLLNHRQRGVGLFRVAVFLPSVVPDVAYALIWLWVFNPLYGPLNKVLGSLGLATPGWLADAGTAKIVFVVMALFQIGEGFVMMLAARRDVPTEFYENARVFGATPIRSFSTITLPLLMPWLLLLTARDLVLSFHNTFVQSYLMTSGDPYYSTLFLSLLAYEEAFDGFRFGPGSAIMLMIFLAASVVVYLLYRLVAHLGFANAS